jgi:hypothetical protein
MTQCYCKHKYTISHPAICNVSMMGVINTLDFVSPILHLYGAHTIQLVIMLSFVLHGTVMTGAYYRFNTMTWYIIFKYSICGMNGSSYLRIYTFHAHGLSNLTCNLSYLPSWSVQLGHWTIHFVNFTNFSRFFV